MIGMTQDTLVVPSRKSFVDSIPRTRQPRAATFQKNHHTPANIRIRSRSDQMEMVVHQNKTMNFQIFFQNDRIQLGTENFPYKLKR